MTTQRVRLKLWIRDTGEGYKLQVQGSGTKETARTLVHVEGVEESLIACVQSGWWSKMGCGGRKLARMWWSREGG